MPGRASVVGTLAFSSLLLSACSSGAVVDAGASLDAGPAASDGARPDAVGTPETIDGGWPDATPAPDADDRPRLTVVSGAIEVGRVADTFTPSDVSSGWTVRSYPEGDPAAIVTGTARAGGILEIVDPPPGRRVVVVEYGEYRMAVVGTSTRIDLVIPRIGRNGPALAGPTALNIDLALASPWATNDLVEVFAPSTGMVAYNAQLRATPQPSPGARAVNDMLLPWDDERPLLEGGPVDDLYVGHYRYERVSATSYRYHLSDLTRTRGVRMMDGAITSVSAVTATTTFPDLGLFVDIDTRDVLAPAIAHPDAIAMDWKASYLWVMGASRHGLYTPAATGMTEYRRDDRSEQRWSSFVVAPVGGMDGLIDLTVRYFIELEVPGAAQPYRSLAGTYTSVLLDDLAAVGDRVGVPLSLPLEVQIAGRDAWSSPLTGVGLTPEVSWRPPVRGHPRSYFVDLVELTVDRGVARGSVVGQLYTDDTRRVSIPEGWLRSGGMYLLRVCASDAIDYSRSPHRLAPTEGLSFTTSRVFSP